MNESFFSKLATLAGFLLVILVGFFFVFPVQAAETEQWCAFRADSENYCLQISNDDEGIDIDSCRDQNPYAILDDASLCSDDELVCCCTEVESIETYGVLCDELGGESKPLDDDCSNVCDESSVDPDFIISATVSFLLHPDFSPDPDDLLANGTYELFSFGVLFKQGVFEEGVLSIEVASGDYTLSLSAERSFESNVQSCSYNQNIEVDNENLNLGDITFVDCTILDPDDSDGPGEGDCVPNWELVWSNPQLQCGELLEEPVDNNSCDEEYPLGVGDVVECPTLPDPVVCGNGVLNEGQQCEIIGGDYSFPDGMGNCEAYTNHAGITFSGGNLRCTPNCLVDTSQCIICPNDVSGCTSSLLCDECDVCDNAPLCQDTCNDGLDLVLSLSKIYYNEIGMGLDWSSLSPLCESGSIKIRRCIIPYDEGGPQNCNPASILMESIPADLGGYSDYDFLPNQYGNRACYEIELTIPVGANTVNLNSDVMCERIPDAECLNREGDSFCVDLTTQGACVEGNLESEPCDNEERCVNPGHGLDARCVDVSFCDRCSGPFGFYSYSRGVDTECTDDNLILNGCFREDYSVRHTLKGKFNFCSDVTSCYDYRTWYTCQDNSCDFDFECEWQPFTEQDELGIGICIPQDPNDQNCNVCDTNPAFGGFCSEELCMLYGDCFYNTNPADDFIVNKYRCSNKHEVGCETYNTVEECEGGNLLDIDVVYELHFGNHIRVQGSNIILENSSDFLNLGKCVWTGDKCVRDASFRQNHTALSILESDCVSPINSNSFRCLTNFEEPETSIFIASQELMEDQTYSTRQFKELMQVLVSYNPSYTYFSLSQQEGGTYPDKRYANFINDVINHLSEEDGGVYYLNYYSKTKSSNNLEVVKSKRINLLAGLPIDISHEVSSSYVPYADMVLSNVSFIINSTVNDFSCEARLLDFQGVMVDEEIITKSTSNGQLTWIYYFLEDGLYNFEVSCWDIYDQLTHEQYSIELNEDNTLSNPTPRMETFRPGVIDLRIESVSEATCSFKVIYPTTVVFEEEFDITGGTIHEAEIDMQNEGFYILRPECVFDPDENGNFPQGATGDGHFSGNAGDYFIFGVDDTAPTIMLYDLVEGDWYDNTTIKQEVELEIICDPYIENLTYSFIDLSSPCEASLDASILIIHPESDEVESEDTFTFSPGDTRFFEAPHVFLHTYLRVLSSDIIGNEKEYEFFLSLRDLHFEVPEVIICDPSEEDC